MTPRCQLTASEQHLLLAAQRRLELGSLAESFAELDNIEPRRRVHPEVLETRWRVFRAVKKWAEAAEVARAIIDLAGNDFDGWWMFSFAMHEAGQLKTRPTVWRVFAESSAASICCTTIWAAT